MKHETQNQVCAALPEYCCLSAPGWMCSVSNTPPTPRLRLFLFPKQFRGDSQCLRRLFCCRANCFSSGVTGSGPRCLEGCLHHTVSIAFFFLPRLVSCSLTLTSSSPSFLSLSHTSQFHSVSPIYCVLLLALPVSFFLRCFFSPFLLLGLLLLPHSHYPTLFCSHFIFHLNTFSLYHSHTHASPPQSNQSGSSPPPPPPTYHRVYCICHHVLLA